MSISNGFINQNKIKAYTVDGILSGLSFAVKDNIDVANEVTSYGSQSWARTHSKPISNAVCLEQLLSSGATYLGKTISDELAYSIIGNNRFYGTPLNPKAPERAPGGSSSGSAAAVASKIVDFAIGTDTNGSIRIPASNCGIWGYRPSHGLISVSGVLPLAPSFDTVGVVAQSGEILAKVIRALLAEDNDTYKTNMSVYFINDVFNIADKRISAAIASVVEKISSFFQTHTFALLDSIGNNITHNWLVAKLALQLSTEVYNTFGSWVEYNHPELSLEISDALNRAKLANRKNIQDSLHATRLFAKKLNEFLSNGNILCFPTTVDLAPRLNEITPEFLSKEYIPRAMGINAISGLSRTPQITVPLAEYFGVPIGISFISSYGSDIRLINLCNQLWSYLNN